MLSKEFIVRQLSWRVVCWLSTRGRLRLGFRLSRHFCNLLQSWTRLNMYGISKQIPIISDYSVHSYEMIVFIVQMHLSIFFSTWLICAGTGNCHFLLHNIFTSVSLPVHICLSWKALEQHKCVHSRKVQCTCIIISYNLTYSVLLIYTRNMLFM